MQCNDRKKKRKTSNILALLFLVVLVNLSVRWQIGLNSVTKCDRQKFRESFSDAF